jgi:outer membrane immunogenic protein
MKKLIVAIFAGVMLSSGAAVAADMALKAPPLLLPVCTWCGFYIGGDIGGYWASQSATTVPSPSPGFGAPAIIGAGVAGFGNLPTTHNLNRNGVLGGGYAGYNWQWNQFVVGFEADISALGRNTASDTETVFATFGAAPIPAYTMTASAGNSWLATARARAGITTGPTLWYVTGGAAWTGTSATVAAAGTNNPIAATLGQSAATSWSDTKTGFVVGGGVEWMFAQHWLLRGEYLYHEFSGSSSVMPLVGVPAGLGCGAAAPCTWAVNTSTLRLNVARVGLAYKF